MTYLRRGEEFGLCKIEESITNYRTLIAKNIETGEEIIFKSIKDATIYFSISRESIYCHIEKAKVRNGYMLKYVAQEEYLEFVTKTA